MKKNESIALTITAINHEGNGVGRHEGMAVFVPGTAVGDQVCARVVKVLKRYAFAIVEALERPSPTREENTCPVYDRCGGCALRHITYAEECRIKNGWVQDNLRRIGGVDIELEPLLPSPEHVRYRNKAQYPVRLVEGRVRTGFFAKRSHRLIPVEDCLLQPTFFREVARCVTEFMEEFGIPAYDELTHTGLVRHLFIRYGQASGESMVWLSVNGQSLPGHEELLKRLRACCPGLRSFGIDVNREQTNVIFGGKLLVLWGEETIRDTLCGVSLSLSPLSFYQVNRSAAERLFQIALEYAAPAPGCLALDVYCGAGAVGLSMARHLGQLIGVDVVPQAVDNAWDNARHNGVQNARFLCADAGEAVKQFRAQGLTPDLILLDPPRKGADQAVIDCVAYLSPETLVYISCDSATLARDCQRLGERGYVVRRARAVDLFPRTANVETVCLLSKLKSNHHIEVNLNMDEFDLTSAESKATYDEIKEYVLENSGLKVTNLYIAQVKEKMGIKERENYNISKKEDTKVPQCPADKEKAIVDALKYFNMID